MSFIRSELDQYEDFLSNYKLVESEPAAVQDKRFEQLFIGYKNLQTELSQIKQRIDELEKNFQTEKAVKAEYDKENKYMKKKYNEELYRFTEPQNVLKPSSLEELQDSCLSLPFDLDSKTKQEKKEKIIQKLRNSLKLSLRVKSKQIMNKALSEKNLSEAKNLSLRRLQSDYTSAQTHFNKPVVEVGSSLENKNSNQIIDKISSLKSLVKKTRTYV